MIKSIIQSRRYLACLPSSCFSLQRFVQSVLESPDEIRDQMLYEKFIENMWKAQLLEQENQRIIQNTQEALKTIAIKSAQPI